MSNSRDAEKAPPSVDDGASSGEISVKASPVLQPLEKPQSRRSRISRLSRASNDTDPLEPLELAVADGVGSLGLVRTATSIGSSASRPPDYEVAFEPDDPLNPKSWSLWYRSWVIFCISYTTWVVVLYSTSYTASISGLMEEFGSSETVTTLGVTTYLLGLAAGSLLAAPASEVFGRRPVYIVCMAIFTLLVLPCALATSLAEILVVRFFGALFGSVMVSNSAGSIVDISTEETRALVMSLWSIAPMNGPVTGPVVGGFVYEALGWRWDNWLVLILGGAAVACMVTCKETYAPSILQRKAAQLRKDTDDERWWTRYDQKLPVWDLLRINLTRPFILFWTEPILWFFNLWISLVYGILYLCFVAYPIVFEGERGWGPGISGLSFLGIGIGTMLVIVSEPLIRRWINMEPKDPETGRTTPEATAKVFLLGAILTPIGQLTFSWTCLPTSIHWAIPIAMGIPFGAGNVLSFIYGMNYLAGAYGIYAASALAGNAVTRSVFGGTLPLAGPTMYAKLTPQWAGTLLGLLEVLMIPIPIVFYRYGAKIRARSPTIRQMREDQAKNESRAARAQKKRDKTAAVAAAAEAEEADNDVPLKEKETAVNDAARDVEKGGSAEAPKESVAAKDEAAP